MNPGSLADRIFLLRRTPAFSRLYDSELGSIARALHPRSYAPGEVVGREGAPLRLLHIVADGAIHDPDLGELPSVFGVASLLAGEPLTSTLTADDGTGAECLVLTRAHFLTLVNEYPPLLLHLLRQWREEIER